MPIASVADDNLEALYGGLTPTGANPRGSLVSSTEPPVDPVGGVTRGGGGALPAGVAASTFKEPYVKVPDTGKENAYKWQHEAPKPSLLVKNVRNQPKYGTWMYKEKMEEMGLLKKQAKQRRLNFNISEEEAKIMVDGPISQAVRKILKGEEDNSLLKATKKARPRRIEPSKRADGSMSFEEMKEEYPLPGVIEMDPIHPITTEADWMLKAGQYGDRYFDFLKTQPAQIL